MQPRLILLRQRQGVLECELRMRRVVVGNQNVAQRDFTGCMIEPFAFVRVHYQHRTGRQAGYRLGRRTK